MGPDCSSATLSNFAASESTHKPLPRTRGISRARSFDLEVTPWAPTRLTSCIFHSGHTEPYEPLRSTRQLAHTSFRDLAAPGSAHKPPVCKSGISGARSLDLEVTRWAPTRLTSSIFHSGHTKAYEPLRSTRRPARAPFNHLAAPGSARKPPVCRSGIVRARSLDLEVTPWAPTRLTSYIFTRGVDGTLEASTLAQPSQMRPPATGPLPNRLPLHSEASSASAHCWRCDLEVLAWTTGRLTPSTFPPEGAGGLAHLGSRRIPRMRYLADDHGCCRNARNEASVQACRMRARQQHIH